MKRSVIIILATALLSVHCFGQSRISAGIRGGYPFSPQEELLEGENSIGRPLRKSASADIQYAFMFGESTRLGHLYPTVYQGIGLSVFSLFDHEDVGTPVSLYVFQGARIARLSPRLSLDYEWNFGASFGWHRYEEHQFNTIVGSKVNAYINGSIMLTWKATENWKIAVGPDMTHYSNGHTDLPNAGLNTIGIRLNVSRTYGTTNDSIQTSGSHQESEGWKQNLSCDVTTFGALKKYSLEYDDAQHIAEGRFGTAGLHINPFYDIRQYFRIGLSLDINYDESANIKDHIAGMTDEQKLRFYHPPFAEQFSIGLSARAELVMPIFSVHFGVGHNLLYKGEDLEGFYQIIALKTHLTPKLYFHTGYQFRNFKNPDHLLIGLGWRFGY
ncbi:MAG: acyloxyacyl hydrolase [Bacteroidales bacterium]|nr:acyloxyacyl hydrolase [Bacteroidales bacterium]